MLELGENKMEARAREHVEIVHELCQKFGLYRQAENSWTKSLRHIG